MLDNERIRRCSGCGQLYDWRKSTSRYLKLTFCGFWCERKSNGFLIEDFDRVERMHAAALPQASATVASASSEAEQLQAAVEDILKPRAESR